MKKENKLLIDEYKKQRKRVLSAYRRLEKIGFIFNKNPIPKIPKKIKQGSINKLANITPEQLRKKSEYIVGEKVVKYKTHKKQVKEEIKQIRKSLREQHIPKTSIPVDVPTVSYIAKFREQVEQVFGEIENFRNDVTDLPDDRAFYHGRNNPVTYMDLTPYKNLFISLLDDRIAEDGEEFVEQLLFENADKIADNLKAIQYDSDDQRVVHACESIPPILKGRPLTRQEAEDLSGISDIDYDTEEY